ncbi:hypothetical protein HPB49_013458 [Dermacentor silvarum]|uniref:Uncharacterized protein n=1 Tax=Dermacentor silvarum TaxID=543639 RepID=A0ACB8E0L4_DERSI|nr:hypothetical protein HPB49_013458 [Dermacentor silvarum]
MIGEARALYNLGNVYHAKGKHIARASRQEPGELPSDVQDCLRRAIHCYEENLKLMVALGDRSAQGRAYGNLGNTYYLLGNFKKAIAYHEQHTKPAKQEVPSDAQKQQRSGSDMDQDAFFELLSEFQSKRMDDQRCSITPLENKENVLPNGSPPYPSPTSSGPEDSASVREELLDLIVGMQSRRMDEQRTSLPQLPGLRRNNHNNNSLHHHHRMSVGSVLEDDFFDMIVRCQEGCIAAGCNGQGDAAGGYWNGAAAAVINPPGCVPDRPATFIVDWKAKSLATWSIIAQVN